MMARDFTIWIIVMAPLLTASQNVQYLSKHKGGSVDLYCDSEDKSQPAAGFYLKRKCPVKTEVLFILEGAKPVPSTSFKGRTEIHGDMSTHQINVTVSSLSHNDSGLYACEFIIGTEYKVIKGRTDYLLFVEADSPCSCAGYSFLLYIISGATALFLLLAFGLGAALCNKACRHSKAPKPLPIYEDMAAGRPLKDRSVHHHLDLQHLEEVDAVIYDKPYVKLSQENHYVSPRTVSHVAEDS
ncbi:cd7 antigen-like [Brienomyrus brachyistius]|uniref:cd7 antigen-like n=1 Tax=Brienomyrus brachyistius TaxID=42636 RepID=UPI0020B24F22|nr:cd7 antigen-like [Brienomyrus brachyistius]